MLVLSCDTSLPLLSVALVRDHALLGTMALEGRGSRNEKLLPAIDWLLAENNVDRRTIDLFAVTRGPGSFTGVRIGLATMQGLALALGKTVCAMSTHEAAAFGEAGRVAITDDAGRGELYVSVFEDGREVVAPHLGPQPGNARVLAVSDLLQRDNIALRCARRAIAIEQAGEGERYRDVTPIYVRLAEAEVKLRQKQNE
ncbi:MAG TPA: tRNA (adenosine(37)-N6)-threonylcarbamoyltransferase complex dimerization subunit type 1 TsaB [Thermoanaerobaculia bacterium]|nr:tRNA (adenosine(37)-N6)-threonylcarbamoyltransferase complex dimerization subunit type 1 TsaB [Thermoanaerobaculia bacterium]